MTDPKRKSYFIRYEGLFWRANGSGYTDNILDAGIYSEADYRPKEDGKISDRGDQMVEVGEFMRQRGYTPERLHEMKERLELLSTFVLGRADSRGDLFPHTSQ